MPSSLDIGNDLLCGLDPVAFANAAGYVLDPWQAKVLCSPAKQIILDCSRQIGKSRVAAVRGLHRAIYHAGSLILLIAPALRQSHELFGYIQEMLATLRETPTAAVPNTDVANASEMRLSNGSRIVCLPAPLGGAGRTIRGFAGADLIIEDEASRFPDEVFHAVTPMASKNHGTLMLMSSPFGKRGHFWDVWSGKTDSPDAGEYGTWDRYLVKATECPLRHSPEFLRGELAKMGRWLFDQEYMGEFSESVGGVFAYDDVMAAFSSKVQSSVAGMVRASMTPPTQEGRVQEALITAATPRVLRPGEQPGTWSSMSTLPYPIDW